jgi:hypothetical protein
MRIAARTDNNLVIQPTDYDADFLVLPPYIESGRTVMEIP